MKKFLVLLGLTALALAGCKGNSDEGKDKGGATPPAKGTVSGNALPTTGPQGSGPTHSEAPDHGELPMPSSSIEGRWIGEIQSKTRTMPLTLEFTAPNKLAAVLDVAQGKGFLKLFGNYKLDGDQLTLKYSDASLAGAKAPPASKVQEFEAAKPGLLAELNSDCTGKVTWVDQDTFRMAGLKGPVTFKRMHQVP